MRLDGRLKTYSLLFFVKNITYHRGVFGNISS